MGNLRPMRMLHIALFVLALGLTAPAMAQNFNPRVTIFAAGSFLRGDRAFIADDDPFLSEFDNSARIGFRGTGDLTDFWGLEVSYAFSGHDLRIIKLDDFPPEERRFPISVHQLFGNGLYYFSSPDKTLRPFVTVGIGWTRFSPTDQAKVIALADEFIADRAGLASSDRFGLAFGVGVEGRVNRWVGVRTDLRDYVTGIPRFGLPEFSFPVSGSIHNVEASVGVVFYLP